MMKMRRVVVMLLGIFLLGIGVALFKVSAMGNDPSNALIMAIGEFLGIGFPMMFVTFYTLFFALEFLFGRALINVGTFVNWFCVGHIAGYFIHQIEHDVPIPEGFVTHSIIMFAGVLILSLGCSLYQTSNLGIAPYDSLSIMLSRWKNYPYFKCRVFTDCVCVVAAWSLGGVIGLGTLVCMFGMGPFISFFDAHISRKLCGN